MAVRPGFSIAGIPVRIQPVFFVVIVALGLVFPWPFTLTWVIIATASVLVHELGHAAAFRLYGLRPSITLHGMGGLTTASIGEPGTPAFTPARSIVTSLAGPLAALALFGVPAYLAATAQGFDPWLLVSPMASRGSPYITDAEILLAQAVYINVGWSLLNLIPVLPLDGGNVTASLFELVLPRQGRRAANVLSILAAGALAWWGLSAGFILAPVLAALLVGMNLSELFSSRHDAVDEKLGEAARALVDFDAARAERSARAALADSSSDDRRRAALELWAWSRLAAGDPLGAQQVAAGLPGGEAPSAAFRAALALALGRVAEGVTTMAWSFAHGGEDRTVDLLAAIAVAQTHQVGPVVHELLLLGPSGHEGARHLRSLLEATGHVGDARLVDQLLTPTAPPAAW